MTDTIIYLDHAAATPLDVGVLSAMQPYFTEKFYNPSSPYLPATNVRREYEQAKDVIASSIGAKSGELIMTAGATESINLALLSGSGHVVTTKIEHHAVIESAKARSATFVDVSDAGLVDVDTLKRAITPETQLVSVSLANNEIGTIQPLKEISAMLKKVRIERASTGSNVPLYFHSDASQGFGLLEVNVARLGVDLLTLNAGKIYGPKQVGALWVRRDVELKTLVHGGGQEGGLRSGTENVAGVVGFAKAVEIATAGRENEVRRLKELRDTLGSDLLDAFPDAVISGDQRRRLPGHLHVSFPNLDAERLLFALESKGVLVATGSACAASKGTRSHVLEAIGLPPEVADGSLRITLGRTNTKEDINRASEAIIQVVADERSRVGLV